MKKISKLLYFLATAAFVAVSCNMEKFEEHTPGDPDVEGCYGIFFPTQDFSAYATLDPKDTTVIPVTVKRSVSTGAISVTPEVVCKDSGIFTASPIVFEDGQEETTIDVSFPNAEIGKTYTCTIQVSDPQYVSKYSSKSAFATFSVTRVKWNYLGKAKWTDDLFTTFYNVPTSTTWEVEAYENDLVKGLYRISDPFGENCPFNNPGDWDTDKDYWVEIHAENPTKVYILPTKTSCHWSYGYFWIGSDAGYDIAAGKTIAEAEALGDAFGTINNGVIKFPVKGLLIRMEQYDNGGWYYGNLNGLFKLILPGGIDVDYSIKAEAGFTKDGKLPVTFTTGVDVAKIRFESFEGELDAKGVKEKATALSAGKTEFSKEVEVESTTTTVGFSYEKTGIYTVVAVSLDTAGTAQNKTSIVLNYVAAGDEADKAVDIKLGVNTAEKYRGVNTDNTLEIWAFSDSADIKDAKMGLFSILDLNAKPEDCIEALKQSESLTDSIIAKINETGYISTVSRLLPGTEYYLLMWASNGYEEDVFISKTSAKTSGKPLPIYQDFSIADIDEDRLPDSSEGYFGKYNLYGVNMYGDFGMREYLGKVTIQDSAIPDEGPDDYGLMDEYMEICGIASGIMKSDNEVPAGYEVNDTVTYDFYGGVFYDIADQELGKSVNDAFYIGSKVLTDEGYGLAGYPYMLLGGFVLDGYIAICSSGNYSEDLAALGYGTEVGYLYTAYSDEGYSTKIGNLAAIGNILLVDESKDDNGMASAALTAAATARLSDFNKISRLAKEAPANLVETRKGRMRSIIDAVKSAPKPVKVYGKLSKAEGYNAVSVRTDFQVVPSTCRTVVDRSSLKLNGEFCRAAR